MRKLLEQAVLEHCEKLKDTLAEALSVGVVSLDMYRKVYQTINIMEDKVESVDDVDLISYLTTTVEQTGHILGFMARAKKGSSE